MSSLQLFSWVLPRRNIVIRTKCGVSTYREIHVFLGPWWVLITMVWCGMIWYGTVWYGMVWYGMVWCGMVCPPVIRADNAKCSKVDGRHALGNRSRHFVVHFLCSICWHRIKAQASCVNIPRRSRCNSSESCCYRAREHVDPT